MFDWIIQALEGVTLTHILSFIPFFFVGLTEVEKDARIVELEAKVTTAGDWKANLSEEARAYPGIEKIGTPGDLLGMYVNLEKTLGKDKVTLLSENPTTEESATFFNRLGRPETKEGYKFSEKIEGVPDNMPKNETMINGFMDVAHSLGLSQKQASGLYEYYQKGSAVEMSQLATATIDAKNKSETALRTKWGVSYPENEAMANKVLKAFAGGNINQIIEKGGNNSALIEMLASIGSKLSEDVLGEGAGPKLMLSPEQARGELAAIMGDPKNAYFDAKNPEHKLVVEKVAKLNQIIYPEDKG